MGQREAFGPNLRRIRLQRGVSLQQLAANTKVSETLWAGLERNDFSRWPNGIFARAYVRQYAKAIGVDPEATVDEFCRWFPHGDRRAQLVIRGHAEIIGHHDLQYRDDVPPGVREGERRGGQAAAAEASAGRKTPSRFAAFTAFAFPSFLRRTPR